MTDTVPIIIFFYGRREYVPADMLFTCLLLVFSQGRIYLFSKLCGFVDKKIKKEGIPQIPSEQTYRLFGWLAGAGQPTHTGTVHINSVFQSEQYFSLTATQPEQYFGLFFRLAEQPIRECLVSPS